jgi:ATP-binding cassette, subfamily B, bacterial
MMGGATGAPGGWRGPEGSLGGLPRTFGLQRQRGLDGQMPIPLDRERLRRVARYFGPYWRQWLVIAACIATSAAVGVLPPLAVRGILDQAIPHENVRLLYLLVAAIIGLNIVNGLIGVLQNYVNARVGEGIIFDLRTSLFEHLQKMSLPFYTATRAGEIVSRINNDVGAVQGVATATIIGIVSNICTVTATSIVIFAINWRLAVLSLVIVPGLYLPTRIVGKYRRILAARAQETQADMLAFIQERLNVGGTMLTKVFGQAGADANAFARHGRRLMDLNVRQALAGRWLFMSLAVFSVAGPAMIYAVGGLQAIGRQLTIGSIIAFVSYLTSLYGPLANLANVYVNVQAALAVFERIFEFLDLEPEVQDRPGAFTLARVDGHVRFEGVSFAYPTANGDDGRFALQDVSFEVRPGERVALVGPSGAGKTTITYLVPRFLDPVAGRIVLDDHDLRDLTQDSLRGHIGMVTQETFLFHATVRENLLYARPNATEAQMITAAESANIHAFIRDLPDGYETVVGERAFRLSGGERQRLAIARALLKDPRILILDEATSNLDATSEHLIQQAMDVLLAGRTSLIVAHRLSTVLNADRILVLDGGRLVEAGRHDELMALDGLYATLYRQQFRKVVAAA